MRSKVAIVLACVLAVSTVCSAADAPARGAMVGKIYSCGTFGMTPEELADAGVGVVSSFPWSKDLKKTKAWIDRCHELGIKVIPYVSPEKAWDDFARVQRRNHGGSIPYYRAVSPSHDRDWVLIGSNGRGVIRYGHWLSDKAGTLRPVWGGDAPNPGAWYMCPNVKGYVEAVLKGVRDTMEFGADGVFIDNVDTGRYGAVSEDYGPKFGKRGHLYPGKPISYAYTELVKKMSATVRAYGPDKIVMLNSGLEPVFAPHRDGGMLESFVYTSGNRRLHSWQRISAWGKQFAGEVPAGRVVAALSYIGRGRDRPGRDDAFYAFAAGKYCDFRCGSVGRMSRPMVRLRVGHAAGKPVDKDGVARRVCERGTVAVNHSDTTWRLPLPAPKGVKVVCDYYSARALPAGDGHFLAEIPPDSGRVYVPLPDALDSYLAECALYLRRRIPGTSDADKVAMRDKLDAEISRIRAALKRTGDIAAVRADVLKLETGVKPEPKWRLSQAAALVSGIDVRATPRKGVLVQGGSVDVRVLVINTSRWPASMRFRKPKAPKGYSVEVPEAPFTLAAGELYERTVRVKRAASAAPPRRQHFIQCSINLGCTQEGARFNLMARPAISLGKGIEIGSPAASVCLLPEAREPLRIRVKNRMGSTLNGMVYLGLPKGWKAARRGINLEPSREGEVLVDVTAPSGSRNRYLDAVVHLADAEKKTGGDQSLAYIPGKGSTLPAGAVRLAREKLRVHAVPGVVVRRAKTAPKLDGRLDDSCWRDAAMVTDLLSYMVTGRPAEDDTLTGPKPAVAKTDVYLAYDDKALYLGLRCHREFIDNLRASIMPGKGKSHMRLWHDDHVECYLDPGRTLKKKMQLMINPAGAVRNLGGGTWKHAAAVGKKSWSAEMVFPFKQVGRTPRPGEKWGANFVRFDYAGTRHKKNQRSEWSCTFEGDRAPYKFGVLVFE